MWARRTPPFVTLLIKARPQPQARHLWRARSACGRPNWEAPFGSNGVKSLCNARQRVRSGARRDRHKLSRRIASPDVALIKDIATPAQLRAASIKVFGACGFAFVETDMRAHRNPHPMRAIERATIDLIRCVGWHLSDRTARGRHACRCGAMRRLQSLAFAGVLDTNRAQTRALAFQWVSQSLCITKSIGRFVCRV